MKGAVHACFPISMPAVDNYLIIQVVACRGETMLRIKILSRLHAVTPILDMQVQSPTLPKSLLNNLGIL